MSKKDETPIVRKIERFVAIDGTEHSTYKAAQEASVAHLIRSEIEGVLDEFSWEEDDGGHQGSDGGRQMTKPHPHADKIIEWAKDTSIQVWCCDLYLLPLCWKEAPNPRWEENCVYALHEKPEWLPRLNCILEEIEFPMPEREAPALGTNVYIPDPRDKNDPVFSGVWSDYFLQRSALERGLLHLSYDAALKHSTALYAANRVAVYAAGWAYTGPKLTETK